MGFAEKIRQIAKIDSRRFAKGTTCRILSEVEFKGITSILVRAALIPTGVTIDSDSGWDEVTGKIFLIPVTKVRELLIELNNYTPSKEKKDEKITKEEHIRRELVAEPIAAFLAQNMIIASTTLASLPGNKKPNPLAVDAVIETVDLSQNTSVMFVERKLNNIEGSNEKWGGRGE